MPPLTPELWAERYASLRPYVLERWPRLDEGKLGAIVGDFDALVGLVAETAGLPEDLARQQLLATEVPEEATQGGEAREASLEQLRLGAGFNESERERVEADLAKLEGQLRRFPAAATALKVSVQERDRPAQEVVLEAWLPKFGHMAATSGQEDLGTALRQARDALWRQIDAAVDKRADRR